MTKIVDIIRASAKAAVAAVAPIVSAAISDIVLELGVQGTTIVTVVTTTLGVWLTPNRSRA